LHKKKTLDKFNSKYCSNRLNRQISNNILNKTSNFLTTWQISNLIICMTKGLLSKTTIKLPKVIKGNKIRINTMFTTIITSNNCSRTRRNTKEISNNNNSFKTIITLIRTQCSHHNNLMSHLCHQFHHNSKFSCSYFSEVFNSHLNLLLHRPGRCKAWAINNSN